MQLMTLQVIGKVTANRGCVKDIASANVLVFLLFTLETLPSGMEYIMLANFDKRLFLSLFATTF